jgi:proteasome beta subunit
METQESKQTGTTTVGLLCKDCVILASETKSTLGYLVSSKEAKKIYQVDDKIALTTAGGVGDTQAITRLLRAEIALYKSIRSAPFTVRAAATLLSNILQSTRYFPYLVMLIVGGHDRDGFHIITVDPLGGIEEDKYVATGSGSPVAYGVLEAEFREGLSREEGIRLAVRAIRAATQRDVFSGGKISIAVIDKERFEFIPEERIKEIEK